MCVENCIWALKGKARGYLEKAGIEARVLAASRLGELICCLGGICILGIWRVVGERWEKAKEADVVALFCGGYIMEG